MPSRPTASELIARQLDHPVIDADGHYIEFMPALSSYLREEGVAPEEMFSGNLALGAGSIQAGGLSQEERARVRATRSPWWVTMNQSASGSRVAKLQSVKSGNGTSNPTVARSTPAPSAPWQY